MQILLVEDTPEQAQIVECYLEIALPKAQIQRTASLAETRRVMSEQQFDVILLDLGLPDVQGIETVTEVHKVDSQTPLVVLTSAGEDGLGVLCLQAGAHDFLEKATVTPQILEKALSFASARKSEETNLCLQKELDNLRLLNPSPVRDFGAPEKLEYQSYLVAGDCGVEAARQITRKLVKRGVKTGSLISLHALALEELAQKLPPERLRQVAGKSAYMALAVMTIVNQILTKKRARIAV